MLRAIALDHPRTFEVGLYRQVIDPMAAHFEIAALLQPGDPPPTTFEQYLAVRPGWMAAAECRGEDVARWFPSPGGDEDRAKGICSACAVVDDCLAFALADVHLQGVWGATTGRERVRLRRTGRAA